MRSPYSARPTRLLPRNSRALRAHVRRSGARLAASGAQPSRDTCPTSSRFGVQARNRSLFTLTGPCLAHLNKFMREVLEARSDHSPALDDAKRAGVAQPHLHRMFTNVAVAAKNLERIICDG